MFKKNVTIINDHPVTKGLGRYAQILLDAINQNKDISIKCLSLGLGFCAGKENYPGQVLLNTFDLSLSRKVPCICKIPDISHFVQSRFLDHFMRKSDSDYKLLYEPNSVIHYTNPGIYPFILNERVVVTIHDLIFMRWHGVRNYIGDNNNKRYIRYYMKVPNIITFTNFVKKEIEKFGFAGRIESFFPPISSFIRPLKEQKESLRDKLGLPKEKILLLSVSTNRPGKNLKALRDMMQLMDDRYRLVRVGVPVGNSITFRGVNDETLNEIYNACDVLVFPSTEEGFGIPVTEAFKVGLPVVASDIEVMREVCGDAAILVEPEPNKIFNSVKEALSNSEILSAKGQTRSLLFSGERFRNNMIHFYERV